MKEPDDHEVMELLCAPCPFKPGCTAWYFHRDGAETYVGYAVSCYENDKIGRS
jgi:hypothetical protein